MLWTSFVQYKVCYNEILVHVSWSTCERVYLGICLGWKWLVLEYAHLRYNQIALQSKCTNLYSQQDMIILCCFTSFPKLGSVKLLISVHLVGVQYSAPTIFLAVGIKYWDTAKQTKLQPSWKLHLVVITKTRSNWNILHQRTC